MIINRKYYPNRIADPDAANYPFGLPVEDTLTFDSWQDAVKSVDTIFRTSDEIVYMVFTKQANGAKCVDLRDKKGRILYKLKTT